MEVYDDLDSLLKYDLIIQSVTMGELHWKQEENLTKAVMFMLNCSRIIFGVILRRGMK